MDKGAVTGLSFSELEPTMSNPESTAVPTIYLRKLPRNTGPEVLRSMLIFAKDLIDTELVDPEYPEDRGFSSAIARFRTLAGAHEARDRLDGKVNAANDANMIVELWQSGASGAAGARRNTIDGTSNRHGSGSTSSGSGPTSRQSSRFNGTFQSLEKASPPNGTQSDGFPNPDSNTRIQNLFSPQSPIGNSFVSSKSMINDDAGDDETGQILQDPVAYAKSGQATRSPPSRRSTNTQMPVSRFAGLSLSTVNDSNGVVSPPLSSFTSPRSGPPMQSPGSAMSPVLLPAPIGSMGPNATYHLTPQHYQRHNYPPVNPADQNPPCNTLYVGNLPIDTSEDELKAMFSKQRGYKRLCFRTKQNGPMCFVEFEDVSFATKALHDLYGQLLHNSVKGGIRLSFSKNPLGVRSGQASGMGPPTPMTPQGMMMPGTSNGIGAPPGFTTATGPPPGLAPPGLTPPLNSGGGSSFGMFGSGSFGMGGSSTGNSMRGQPLAASTSDGAYHRLDGGYSGYMMGR